jgi:molybdate transport system substrate-binding protein
MSDAGKRAELRIICAGGFKAAMEQIAPLFEGSSGCKMQVTIGTPADTRRMMTDGTAFDAFIVTRHSINEAAVAALVPETRFSVAKSPVGMGVREALPIDAIGSESAFRAAISAVRSIGLSDPTAGTALAKDILAAAERLGLRQEIEAKVRYIMGPGFVVAQRVAAGEADAVMTLATEIIPAKGIRYLGEVPSSMGLGTVFDAGIAKASAASTAANDFLRFLKTDEVRAVMQRTGLVFV